MSARVDTRTGDRHKPRSGDRHKGPRPLRQAQWERRIIAIDGEGWGVDEHGRQNYMLMVAADEHGWSDHLYTGKRLTTDECLSFMWNLPTAHLTSYVFSYDVSQILRDVPYETQNAIFTNGFTRPPIYWEGWSISYVAHKMLAIGRPGLGTLTVYDAIGFWQQSYLKTLEKSPGIDPTTFDLIKAGKERRTDDQHDWQQELTYSTAECSTLAYIQRTVYESCRTAGYPLSSFYGAGSLAKTMLRKEVGHAIAPIDIHLPKGASDGLHASERKRFEWFLDAAYFGGRFETIGNGYLPRVYMADIRNAYPAAATLLPCLYGSYVRRSPPSLHGVLSPNGTISGMPLPLGVWEITWTTQPGNPWGPLPQRTALGTPSWPMNGHGIAYTPEILAAAAMPGVSVRILGGYILVAACRCQPWEWLKTAYAKRNAYKLAGDPREKVFKLGPNAVYGALAQNVGRPKYRSLFLAGLITATTRATLLDSIRANPDVVALATDSVWSTAPLALRFEDALGAWADEGPADDVWLIQPGLAYSEDALHTISKTRGIPLRIMNTPGEDLRTPWVILTESWRENWQSTEPVTCQISSTRYIGLGTAKNLNDPNASGRWVKQSRNIKFGSDKRPYFRPSTQRPLWRDSFPADVGWDITLASREIYAAELLEASEQPEICDDLTTAVAFLGE
jgi:hypothetical protein